ncbi:NUDIX domain-containing protein [Chloroflexi bacterium TSY]|nr:NUDIX domain-containing protein [Chloroflexi bacterium TSY]
MAKYDFIFCPFCATKLEQRLTSGQIRPTCPKCAFVHFRDPKVAVTALVTYQKKILLIRRAVDPEKGKWALPGGYMDAGEMPDEALQRELMEEVQLAIRVGSLIEIFPIAPQNAGTTPIKQGIVLTFRAEPVREPVGPLIPADDVSEAARFRGETLPIDLAFESTHKLLALWKKELGVS